MQTMSFKNKPILSNPTCVSVNSPCQIKKSPGLFSMIKKIDQMIDRQSETIKNVLGMSRKFILAAGSYTGKNYCPDTVRGMEFADEVLDVYSSMHDLYDWYDYFTASYSCQTIDPKRASESLKQVLKDHGFLITGRVEKADFNDRVEEMVKELITVDVLSYENEAQAREKLKGILTENLENAASFNTEIDLIANEVQLKQKSYSVPLMMSLSCLTAINLVDSVMTLEKWGVFPFSKYAIQVGRQVPIFECVRTTVLKIGIDRILNSISSIGIASMIGDQTYEGAQALTIYLDKEATDKEQKAAKKKLWSASLCVVTSSVSLARKVVPLIVDCAMAAENWGVFPFSKYAIQLGTQVPIFKWVVATVLKIGADPILNAISCIGIAAIIGVQTYKGAKALTIYFDKNKTDEEQEAAKKKVWKASVCIVSSSVDLAFKVVPLCLAFSPFISIVVLPALSKGTGLICNLIK